MNGAATCRHCPAPAHCVGWHFPGQVPDDVDPAADTLCCADHCDHDACASVEERSRERRGPMTTDTTQRPDARRQDEDDDLVRVVRTEREALEALRRERLLARSRR